MANPDYSAANLDRFLIMAGDKGLMNASTAKALRVAATKVLSVVEDHQAADLRQLDREEAFRRFQNKFGMNYSPDSLSTYRSRFTSAADAFLTYVDNPSGYKPGASKTLVPSTGGGEAEPDKKSRRPKRIGSRKVVTEAPASALQEVFSGAIEIPIPIRERVVVKIQGVPMDLSQEEAKKISAVIQAYATK